MPSVTTILAIFAVNLMKTFSFSSAFLYPTTTSSVSQQKLKENQISSTELNVSELHIPGYRESKKPFMLEYESSSNQLIKLKEETYESSRDYSSLIPHENGYLLHKTTNQIISPLECNYIIQEADEYGEKMGWTTNRHGNYPTTDIPLVELPNTLKFLRYTLAEKIYPLLKTQFGVYLPPTALSNSLRVADGFIVKYDANGGQSELKPHRDGSVISFNIALNPSYEYEGGGTWFNSLSDSVKIEQGQIVSHASGILHGGHAITKGIRYILVAFVIVEGYDAWSMRFYNSIRDK